MINFRFHIVSLTAVLLALGIGLLLGTTFLDDAVIDGLKDQLDDLERDLDNAQERNADLGHQLDVFENEASGLDEQLGERLFDGQLDGQPVLIVAPRGIDRKLVDRVSSALDQADADTIGVWWLTDRLVLDDDDEVTDLTDATATSSTEPEELRHSLAAQLASVLAGASEAIVGSTVGGAPATPPGLGELAPAEPAVLARLHEAGFVDYDVPEGGGDVVRLPSWGLRTVVVSGPGAVMPVADLLVPLLTDLVAHAPAPVVAVDPRPVVDGSAADAVQEPRLVTAIRADDELSRGVSTVDALDLVAGRVATVLALVDARPGEPRIGHYGVDDGAQLLPGVPDEGD